MTAFDLVFAAILLSSGLLIGAFAWAFRHPALRSWRIERHVPLKVPVRQQILTNSFIGLTSVAMTLGVVYGLRPWLLRATDRAWPWLIGEALLALFVYDFLYYFLHRAMHLPRLMRFAHAVHHRARFPTAVESLYQHPLELISGMAVLVLALWLVGPLSPTAFLLMFGVYSTLNVLNHIGMAFPVRWLAPLNFVIRKHYLHHSRGRGNYASISPLPDWLFGTLR